MDQSEQNKRIVPKWLKVILNMDAKITKSFIELTKNNSVFNSLKIHHYLFEISCHGIIWLSVLLASVWVFALPSMFQLQANLFLALILDIITIAFLKAATRRRRPSLTSSSLDFGPDKFSFPSGHASRSTLVAYVLLFVYQVPMLCAPSILAWTVSVCVSRVLAERHYVLDVVGGVLIGFVEGALWSLLWLSPESSQYILSFVTDEGFFGAEYHV